MGGDLHGKSNIFESITDNDIEFISKLNLNDEEVSTLLSLFELISEDNKQKALDLINILFNNKKLVTISDEIIEESIGVIRGNRESESYKGTLRLLGDI